MEEKVLEIKNLTKYYGKLLAVEDLSLSLNKGEIFGFIGPNGAGKSTTIRSIMRLINMTHGHISILGKDILKMEDIDKTNIGYLPSEVSLYSDSSVKDMLDFHESFYKKNIHTNRVRLVKLLKLDESKKVEDLSFGNLKKLGIVLAFMHEPKLVILDEATSGLDPIMQQVFYTILLEEKKKGTTIFYSTHILSEVSKICDRVGIIKDGRLISVESVEELKKKNLSIVTVYSKDIDKIEKDLKIDVLDRGADMIRFNNTSSDDKLLKALSKYTIDKIYIEEPSFEDMFLHYYR